MFLEKGFIVVYQAQNNRDVSPVACPLSIAIYTITVLPHHFIFNQLDIDQRDLQGLFPQKVTPCSPISGMPEAERLSWGVMVFPSSLVHSLLCRLTPALGGSCLIYGPGHCF